MEDIKRFFAKYWQSVGLSALCVILVLVLVVLILATTYVHHVLNLVTRTDDTHDQTLSSEEIATATETIDPEYTGEVISPEDVELDVLGDTELPQLSDVGIVNILLVGQDRREGEPRQRSDSMILCTFNTATNEITMTSLMRDTYVYIPGYGNNKMNAAYMLGGFSLLNETLAVNYGISVDANVEVNFSDFAAIIDLLGGVDIELTLTEANYMNEKRGFEYNKDEQWNLTEGVNHLNGDQALAYSRIRYVATGSGNRDDFGRTERQRTLLQTLIGTYKDQSLTEMVAMLHDILPMITTDMTNNEILGYAAAFFPMLSSAAITTQSIPAEGTYYDQSIEGIGACLIPDLAENRGILARTLYGE